MNRNRHRVVFNAARGQRMVVAENASSSNAGSGASGEASTPESTRVPLTLLALNMAMAFALGTANAQIVADPSAPANQRPIVLQTGNGIPLVQIRTPSAAGVSRNTYGQFDIQSNGAVLNNVRSNAAQTQIGGFVQANPFLSTGAARVILNEVNSSNPSYLNGPLEVAGQRAEVIVANPSGIRVSGGTFLNASGVTLTTGTPVMNSGYLDSFLVRGGVVHIDGLGLDTRTADATTILARAVEVNAGLWAQHLKVVTFTNRADLKAGGTATVQAAELHNTAAGHIAGTHTTVNATNSLVNRGLIDGGNTRIDGRRRTNSSENVIEIAWRVFGEQAFVGKGLLERLASPGRGVLGWNDLMLFRLQCSADRGGQLYNLHRALIVDQDMSAPTSGPVDRLALLGMRKLSQRVFALFRGAYIDAGRNFIAEAYEVPVDVLLGQAFVHFHEPASREPESEQGDATMARRVAAARSLAASFVIYQLSNALPPNGSGVGCGHYDESGAEDRSGISRLMNDYIFGFCFSPLVNGDNVLLFLDHCLAHLSSPFHTGRDDEGYVATKSGLSGGLNPKAMGRYWLEHRDHIRGLELQGNGRCVFMPGYTAFYRDDLDGVFAVLDELAEDAASATN